MITKECRTKKYCCFYASDFHLEMILLPYIKNNINKSKFVILTENNLEESVKLLLNRINLNLEQKKRIMDLDWSNNKIKDISYNNCEHITIIINGGPEYKNSIHKELENLKFINISYVDCYNIEENDSNMLDIRNKYDGMLNVSNN